jgi:hypothetical protein
MAFFGSALYLVGIATAGYMGFVGGPWYFIFVASAIIALGHLFIRAPQMLGHVQSDGPVILLKTFGFNVVWLAVITAPVYFIGTAIA